MGEIKKYEKCQNPYEILNQKKLWRRDDLLSEFCLIKYLVFLEIKKSGVGEHSIKIQWM